MFIPKEFELNDKDEMIAFMKRYNFGIIVTSVDDVPVATHLPFHMLQRNEKTILTAHFARANKQWVNIEEKTALIIFSQPHAYISPKHYVKEENVPTWNYLAVHAYGKCTIINDATKGLEILEQMIMQSEPGYKQQWDKLDPAYKMGLFKGIVPFEVEITDLKAAAKLSQNKTKEERQHIITALENSPENTENDIAAYMRKQIDN